MLLLARRESIETHRAEEWPSGNFGTQEATLMKEFWHRFMLARIHFGGG